MSCTGYISFDFELQVYFSKKKSSVIPRIYVIVILLNRNISCVMDILEILQKVLMYFTLAHHIKHYFWPRVLLVFHIHYKQRIYGSLTTMDHSVITEK